MNEEKYIAHVRQALDGQWVIHTLEEHLEGVAKRAEVFATLFGGGDWAALAGFWHDLGKYLDDFQRRIKIVTGYDPDAHMEGRAGKVDHSIIGAILAVEKFEVLGRVIAYIVAGHHAGLPDWEKDEASGRALRGRMAENKVRMADLPDDIPDEILNLTRPTSPLLGGKEGFALWVRMLFSCLVDADRLDTEEFMDEGKSQKRSGYPDLKLLKTQFDQHMSKFSDAEQTPVNHIRNQVLQQCRNKALGQGGIFSLTVPTGGGKTLSSLAFALDHAQAHKKQRIIYVIPYTSIIEQTANIFRNIFADGVVEHHSNFDPDETHESKQSSLATENWDAPVIVTTNVQFFESLFASRTSSCRKLHNIVNSVVVLDEAQLLPPEFLQPILNVMNQLAKHYKVTFVISTATQPALGSRTGFDWKFKGLDEVREIVDDPEALYKNLERVTVELPAEMHKTNSWPEMATTIGQHESVLAIVNTRKDARELHRYMPSGTLHLSALMCGEHRSQVIQQIKQRLKDNMPTRVVSTQLVEAGVDMDFPVVYRAMAGLDSIAQAAGRCNREGKLHRGKVVVFVPPKPSPVGHLRRAEQTTTSILAGHDGPPLTRDNFRRYFEQFYATAHSWDKHDIDHLLSSEAGQAQVQFRTAAERFKLIEESGYQAIFIYYDDASRTLIGRVEKEGPERWLMRKLQRYCVNVPQYQFKELQKNGDVREAYAGLYVQASDALYDMKLGLMVGECCVSQESLVL